MQMDWSEIGKSNNRIAYMKYYNTVNGIDIWYCYGSDDYYFSDADTDTDTDTDSEVSEGKLNENIDVNRLPDNGISIWGKPDKMLMSEIPGLDIPEKSGDITFEGEKIGFVSGFSGVNFRDLDWIRKNIEALNKVVAKTGFWYNM
jgi:hypothetical protein